MNLIIQVHTLYTKYITLSQNVHNEKNEEHIHAFYPYILPTIFNLHEEKNEYFLISGTQSYTFQFITILVACHNF
jgi:hypothetical protein